MQTTPKFILYDYLNEHGHNEFKEWTQKLQKVECAKLNARLDMLASQGSELFPQILTGTPTAGILKLRVKVKSNLDLCCAKALSIMNMNLHCLSVQQNVILNLHLVMPMKKLTIEKR